MLNVDFIDKGLGMLSPAHSLYDFSTKIKNKHIALFLKSFQFSKIVPDLRVHL